MQTVDVGPNLVDNSRAKDGERGKRGSRSVDAADGEWQWFPTLGRAVTASPSPQRRNTLRLGPRSGALLWWWGPLCSWSVVWRSP